MSVEVRLLLESELALANDFYNTIYKTNRTFENFLWEFVEGPAGKAIYVCAIDRSDTVTKIVGIQCAIPLELMSADGQVVLTAKSEDTLVHPDYRGQKLFERMYDLLFSECQKAGIKYIWGFTPAVKAFERIGFEIPFRTAQALLVLKPIDAFKHLASLNVRNNTRDRMKILGLSFLGWINGLKSRLAGTTKLIHRQVSYYDKDQLIKTFYAGKSLFFLRQTTRYNDWRLKLNPFGNNYINIVFSTENQTSADTIINIRKDVSYIEQLLLAPTLTDKELTAITGTLVKELANADTPLIRVLCFTNSEEGRKQISILKKAGFTYLDRGNYFVWKSLDDTTMVPVANLMLSRLFTQGNL